MHISKQTYESTKHFIFAFSNRYLISQGITVQNIPAKVLLLLVQTAALYHI